MYTEGVNEAQDRYTWVVGIDEVGRGPVAGPVTVGACMVHVDALAAVAAAHEGVTDSKALSGAKREVIAAHLRNEERVHLALASVPAAKIDTIGISKALHSAVAKTLRNLAIDSQEAMVLLDGRLYAPKHYQQKTIVRGDASQWVIGAASIVAKVHRDAYMVRQAKKFPRYGFDQHKGYGTKQHYAALEKYGLCPLHRRSFLKSLADKLRR